MAMLNKSSGIRLNSTFLIEQAKKEELELNKLVTEDKKVRKDLMFEVAPSQMIKSLKKNSNSYEASQSIYTSIRKKEKPKSKEELEKEE